MFFFFKLLLTLPLRKFKFFQLVHAKIVLGNLQYNFSMDQLEKLDEVNPHRMGKTNRYIKY